MPEHGRIAASLLVAKLGVAYRRAVLHRTPRTRVPGLPSDLLREVAGWLRDPCLVDLFIESAFKAMPESWCQQHFKRNHPPANVVFGGDCRRRYDDYIAAGERVPVKESH